VKRTLGMTPEVEKREEEVMMSFERKVVYAEIVV
jgi:hypothetical protein